MANRSLPNVDPDALSKLASQYPPSSSAGREEPKLGGGSETKPASSSGATGSAAAGGKGAQDSGAGRTSAGGGSAGQAPPAPRRSGGGFAGFLAFLSLLVSIGAVIVIMAAPSLREDYQALLNEHATFLSPEWQAWLAGADTGRLEVTFEGLDQRIGQLTDALERVVATEGVDASTARELLLKTESNERLAAAEASLDALRTSISENAGALEALTGTLQSVQGDVRSLADGIGTVDAALSGQKEQLDGLAGRTEALDQQIQSADKSLATATTDIRALSTDVESLKAGLGRVEETGSKSAAQLEAMAGRIAALETTVAAAATGIDDVARILGRLEEQQRRIDRPLIAVSQLRSALDTSNPYQRELVLAKQLLGSDAGMQQYLSILQGEAAAGVATVAQLQRDFRFIASQMGSSISRIQSWGQRISSWFEALLGMRALPETAPAGRVTATIASIDAALDSGDLDLAIEEAVMLHDSRNDVLLDSWLVEARKRRTVERAFEGLTSQVYAKLEAAG